MGSVPEWFKALLVQMRVKGFWYLTKGKASRLAYQWLGKKVSPESVARYMRWAVEEGYLINHRGPGRKGIYYLTDKVDSLIEVQTSRDLGHAVAGDVREWPPGA